MPELNPYNDLAICSECIFWWRGRCHAAHSPKYLQETEKHDTCIAYAAEEL